MLAFLATSNGTAPYCAQSRRSPPQVRRCASSIETYSIETRPGPRRQYNRDGAVHLLLVVANGTQIANSVGSS